MVASPNWLIVLGLVYAGIGVALVAGSTLLTSSIMSAGTRARSRFAHSLGSMAMMGAALALVGFILQAAAQFYAMPLNGTIAFGLALLMLALVALAAMIPITSWSEEETAIAVDAAQHARRALAAHAAATSTTDRSASDLAAVAAASNGAGAVAAVKRASAG